MGPTSITAYDKLGIAPRIETTANDVAIFKHFRDVRQVDGTIVNTLASMRKSIYSLGDLATITRASNTRYLDFLSAPDDPSDGVTKLATISSTLRQHNQPLKGVNFFDAKDIQLLRVIARGEYTIAGSRNKQIRAHLATMSTLQVTGIIKRLRMHGLNRKRRGAYRYRLTKLETKVVAPGLKIRELSVVPELARCK